jgi:hypothetical protein
MESSSSTSETELKKPPMESSSSTSETELKKPPMAKIEIREHPDFRTINVGGAFGGQLGMRFEVTIYSQHYEASKVFLSEQQPNDPLDLSRTLECRLVIDPSTFKILVHWLTGQLNAFESQYGQIPTPEEIQQKIASIEAEAKKKTTGIG